MPFRYVLGATICFGGKDISGVHCTLRTVVAMPHVSESLVLLHCNDS